MSTLFDDPEIDFLVPKRPRLLPETHWFVLDRTRLLVTGALNGLIFPSSLGQVDVLEFANTVDGRSDVESLLAHESEQVKEDRRSVLSMFYSQGLLEEMDHQSGDGAANGDHSLPSSLPFLARSMGQTRVWNSRRQLSDRLERPVRLLNAAPSVEEALRDCGMSVIGPERAHEECDLTVCFVTSPMDRSTWQALRDQGSAVLLISLAGEEMRVGPMLLGRGTSSIDQCMAIHANVESVESYSDLWDVVVANAILLIASGTTWATLVNRYVRYIQEGSTFRTAVEVVPRGIELAPAGSADIVKAGLLRQTQMASPPSRYVGYKAYETHFMPKYVAASRHLPGSALGDALIDVLPDAYAYLLRALDIAFGYRRTPGEVRNCPSGGNLGSPEAMVVHYDPAKNRQTLYRFVGLRQQLELVTSEAWQAGNSQERVVVAAIGNVAKLKFKYKVLGDNIVRLDAGVAAAFYAAGIESHGVATPVFNGPSSDLDVLQRWLEPRLHAYQLTWWTEAAPIKRGWRQLLASSHHTRLRNIVESRRSVRQLKPTGYAFADIFKWIAACVPASGGRVASIFAHIHPVVFIDDREGRAVVELQCREGEYHTVALPGVTDTGDLICQKMLSRAPVKIFFFANLSQLLADEGEGALDEALRLIGEWVGRIWLHVSRQGLSGCPAGAVVESDILRQLSFDAADGWFNLFCFNIGRGS